MKTLAAGGGGTAAGALAMLAVAAAALPAQEPLPALDDVVRHLDEMYRYDSSHAVMTMTVVRERGTRELTLESWSRGEDDALIVIRAPSREAGTATLRTEEGLWNYAPRADRLIRIPTGPAVGGVDGQPFHERRPDAGHELRRRLHERAVVGDAGWPALPAGDHDAASRCAGGLHARGVPPHAP
jgi:hypothetical protein